MPPSLFSYPSMAHILPSMLTLLSCLTWAPKCIWLSWKPVVLLQSSSTWLHHCTHNLAHPCMEIHRHTYLFPITSNWTIKSNFTESLRRAHCQGDITCHGYFTNSSEFRGYLMYLFPPLTKLSSCHHLFLLISSPVSQPTEQNEIQGLSWEISMIPDHWQILTIQQSKTRKRWTLISVHWYHWLHEGTC